MNGAVLSIARSELRRRWPALVALGLLAGIAGIASVGALAVARRTTTADERLAQSAQVGDAIILTFSSGEAAIERVTELPLVERSWRANGFVGQADRECVAYFGVASGASGDSAVFSPVIVDGRAFRDDAPHEVVVFERFATAVDIAVGDVVELDLLTRDEFFRFDTGFGAPDGPTVELSVVGIARASALPDAIPPIVASPAFRDRYREVAGFDAAALDLRGGAASIDEMEQALDELSRELPPPPAGAEEFGVFDRTYPARTLSETADSSENVLVVGLTLFFAVATITGLLALTQGFARHHAAGAQHQLVESALGMPRWDRALGRALPAVIAALVAWAVTTVGVVAAGVIEPMGGLRLYEPNPGWSPNIAIAVLGGLVVAGVVLAVAAATAWRAGSHDAGERSGRSGTFAERLASAGAAPFAVIGVRFALERGRGRRAVPVRSAITGAIVGAVGVLAALTFATNVDRLLAEPERWGWDGDFMLVDVQPDVLDELEADRRVAAVAVFHSAPVSLEGQQIPSYAIEPVKGTVDWTMFEGRAPRTPREIALGARLADQLDRGVGDTVSLTRRDGERSDFAVVGVGVGPTTAETYGGSALMGIDDQRAMAQSELGFVEAIVRVASGSETGTVMNAYCDYELSAREPPVDVDNLRQLGRLPEALAGFVGLVGVVALANGLVVAGRRRSHELAVLRTIGFTPRQAATTLVTMATTVAVAALVLGLPAGVALGGTVWRAIAESAYVPSDARVPLLALAIAVPATIVLALVVAAVPARRARRLAPADLLRTE